MFKTVSMFAGLVAMAEAKTLWHQLGNYTFADYVQEYNKVYTDAADEAYRRGLFEGRLSMIKNHNNLDLSWKLGMNKFADMTEDEMMSFKGFNKALHRQNKASFPKAPQLDASGLPASIDWRDKKVVTDVKDQQQCGSCWAFSATETIESHVAIKTGKLWVLAPQQMVDCVKNPKHCGGTGGCEGATQELGFAQIAKTGAAEESAYPYTAQDGTCQSPATVAKITGFVKNPENNYTALMAAVANTGPQAITVDAGPWMFYESGVFDGCKKDTDLDHGVQLVGYGTDTADYWIVRNSWGEGWGESGYIRIKRNGQDWCGTDSSPADGTGCTGGPASVKTCGTCGILYDTSYPTQ